MRQVRLVFNAGPPQSKPSAAAATDERTRRSTDSELLTDAKATAQPEELDPAEAVAQMLEDIATEQKGPIESICRHVRTDKCIAGTLQCPTECMLSQSQALA